jgi:HPt (histidine-containing phosphotransfer) domain-containing protein
MPLIPGLASLAPSQGVDTFDDDAPGDASAPGVPDGRDLADRDPKEIPGLAELRAEYLDHHRAESSRLEQALKKGNFELLRKAGHNLKGTGTSYGFAELTEIGRALETAAKENDAAVVDVSLKRILSYLAVVRPSPEDKQDAEQF